MQYKRISADCHLDMPCMPPELFVENASRELKERMPYVEDGPDGPHWVAKNGANFGLVNGVGPGGAKYVPGQNYRVDKMDESASTTTPRRASSAAATRICGSRTWRMDGVDAEVIYGVLGTASKLNDKEASNEVLRIYNDWLKEFCSHYPDRQLGLACLPYGDIDEAVKEIHRVAKMGLRGLELSCSWDMVPMWHPDWEKLWKAVAEVDLPLHFHTFPTTDGRARQGVDRAGPPRGDVHRRLGVPDGPHQHHRGDDRRRRVRPLPDAARSALARAARAGSPMRCDRMDFEFEDRFRDLMKLKPSEYWRRKCKCTFQFDPHRRQADRRYRPRDDDVGLRLPAYRRHLAGIEQVHRGAVRRADPRADPQDHLRERRQVLPLHELDIVTALARNPAARPAAGFSVCPREVVMAGGS